MLVSLVVAALFGLSAVACFGGAYHGSRLHHPDARAGLRALLVLVGLWALLQAIQMLTTDRVVATALFTGGLIVGFGTVFAWLYFCSAYTGHSYHREPAAWVGAIALYGVLTAIKLTNPIHGQYFTASMATEPYTRLVVDQGVVYWVSFLLAYVLTAVGVYLLFRLFRSADRPTGRLNALVLVTALPIVPKLASGLYPTVVPELSYEPVGVALFAVGVLYFVDDTFEALEAPTRKRLFEQTDRGVVSIDSDGVITEFNAQAASFLPGLGTAITTRADLLDRFGLETFTDETQSTLIEDEAGRTRRYRIDRHTLELGPHLFGESVFIDETTGRHRRKQNIRLFEKVVETTAQAVLITDREGVITYVNPAFEAQTGYTAAEAIGRTPSLLNSGTHDAAFFADLWSTILDGETWGGTIVNQRKSGMLYTAKLEISPIIDEDGEITHFVGMESDITDDLQRNQQLTVLNRLLRHNLRNGMNVIQGNADLLANRVASGEARSCLQAIRTRAETLAIEGQKAAEIQSLLAEDVSPEARYDVCGAVDSMLAAFEARHPTVAFSLDCAVSTPLWADDRLDAAISELLTNAVRHNDPDGLRVRVSVEPATIDGHDEWVDIVVADTGSGIPDHEREIIEAGHETALEHTTGVGLWLVHWTVSLFGGRVSIREVDGETRIRLRLLAAPAVSDADPPDGEAATRWIGSRAVPSRQQRDTEV